MGGDEIIAHVARMGGREAQPRKPVDLGQFADETRQRPVLAVRAFAGIGIDVLAQQRDLAHALGREPRASARICEAGRENSAPRV